MAEVDLQRASSEITIKKDSDEFDVVVQQSPTSSRDSVSPEESCAICLGRPCNKSFTDSCFHTFCFTCLLEWSKVKPECPLCKQRFKSIVHNVRSFEDYDQYFVNNRSTTWNADTAFGSFSSPNGRRFRYPTTLTAERQNIRALERRLASQQTVHTRRRVRSLSSPRIPMLRPVTSLERRSLYDRGLWVRQSSIEGNPPRFRETSPAFFRANPACTHRLIPWLNREMVALLDNSESQVAFVMELILALILRYEIRSPEFEEHIRPFFGVRTSHFIHEFYNFARSPHDMSGFDIGAVYEVLETIADADSSGSSTIRADSPSLPGSSQAGNSGSFDQVIDQVIDLFVDSSNDSEFFFPRPGPSSIVIDPNQPGPSGASFSQLSVGNRANSAGADEDCFIVKVVKPRNQRTPEMVNLISSSDDEAPVVQGASSSMVSQDHSLPSTSRDRTSEQASVDSSSKHRHKSRKRSRSSRKYHSRHRHTSNSSISSSDEEKNSNHYWNNPCGECSADDSGSCHRTLTVTRESDSKIKIRSVIGAVSTNSSLKYHSSRDSHEQKHQKREHKKHKKSKKHKHKHRHVHDS